ncbi:MAG TPA: peptidoglycan-associated lipoprotein Pal [Acidisarcina sp.]|nr:peptidoglycan-associated lipoprotein Pal [Acidisarcina sp.]
MIEKELKYLVSFVILVSLAFAVGCGKKKAEAPPPPPPPAEVTPAPTAEITATPTAVTAGDKVVLAWRTTNATDVSIEGLGTVSAEGTQTVNPTASTNYHLIARGAGGSADATARVTVNTPAPVVSNADVVDENTFHQNVQDVFYDYDSYDLRGDAQATVSKDASFFVAHPTVKVVVGGYCDERGSTEYNLALGENRANAAKQALANAGVSPDRLRVVSYGKEKQFCSEHDESCWQQNRRAQFALDK